MCPVPKTGRGSGLIPARKGEPSRNPHGRPPKELQIPTILREIGAEICDPKLKRTRLESLLRRVYQFALQGEAWAVAFVADRMEGKPAQMVVSTNLNANLNTSNLSAEEIQNLSDEALMELANKIAKESVPAKKEKT